MIGLTWRERVSLSVLLTILYLNLRATVGSARAWISICLVALTCVAIVVIGRGINRRRGSQPERGGMNNGAS